MATLVKFVLINPASTPEVLDLASTSTSASSDAAPQLRLRDRTSGRRLERVVDGGWWPRTRDLTMELGPLLAAVEAAGYEQVRRVSYNPTAWDRAPRHLIVDGRLVKLGGFYTQEPASVTLSGSSGWNNIDLVVIAPDADAAMAERALDIAAREGDLHRADEIIGLAKGNPTDGRTDGQTVELESWDSDGGYPGAD